MALQTRSDMELWDRPFQTLLIGVLGVNIVGHIFNVPWWVLLASGISLGWKLGHLYFGWPLPKRPLLYALGAAMGGAIIWEYKTMLGHEAATPILVFLASLKLLETNRDRDAMFIIVTSYFLLMAHLLHSQSLGSTFFMAFDVAIITILMFQLHRADRRVTQKTLRPVVRLLIFTIPVWLCLFVVFPRFSLKMFRTSQTRHATGFNEGLDPGSVSSLAQSDEVAFRVRFKEGPRRSPEELYWRGATLYDAAEMKWRPRSEAEIIRTSSSLMSLPLALNTKDERGPSALEYEIVTENGSGHALFTLPRVALFSPENGMEFLKAFVTNDGLIRLTTPKYEHISYSVVAIPENESKPESMTREMAKRTLAPPLETSVEYDELVEDLKREAITPHHAMRKIDDWLSSHDFRYTLAPGDAKTLTLDDFLFRSKKGFCEHYAAASAALLRSLGFNSRVVVGYQGGKWNDVSKALIVRSRDAHAWVEVWTPIRNTPGLGRWVTYDPTAAVAPLRLRLGGDFLDLPEEQQRGRDADSAQILEHLSQNLLLRAFDRTLMVWDFAQMSWTQFLLGYDRSGQRNLLNTLLAWLGLTTGPWVMSTLIVAFLGIVLRLIFLWHSRGPRETALRREWSHLERELARIGAMRSITDGPLTIRDRVSKDEIKKGIEAFIELQYGRIENEDFRQKIRLIRLARRSARQIPTQTFVAPAS